METVNPEQEANHGGELLFLSDQIDYAATTAGRTGPRPLDQPSSDDISNNRLDDKAWTCR